MRLSFAGISSALLLAPAFSSANTDFHVNRCRFSLHLTPEQCLKHYSGQANSIVTRTDAGLLVAFPAVEIRRFVSHDGLHGRFEIVFDRHNKLVSLKRVGS